MMQQDMGIIYTAKLKEVRETIKKLSDLSFDMTEVIKMVNTIESDIEKKVQSSYSSFGNSGTASCFLHDTLIGDYQQAKKKLDSINESLKREWESYYKIDMQRKTIEKAARTVNENNIRDIVSSTKSLLDALRKTTTIDFNIEKNLVHKVYGLVYKVMKLELVLTNETRLLEHLKLDSVNIPYIVDLMKKDMKKIGKEEQEELEEKIVELEKEGIDSAALLDKRLLILLSLYGNEDFASKKKEDFLKRIESAENIGTSIERRMEDNKTSEERISDLTKQKKKNFRKRTAKRIVLLINAVIVTMGIGTGVLASRNITKGKEYRTITTTYDSSIEDSKEEETYERGKDGSIALVEYSPWDSKGVFRDTYKRNMYTYDISGVEEKENLSDYLTEDIKDEITFQEKVEEQEETPIDLGYTENKYVITRVEKDLDTFNEVDSPVAWSLLSILFSAGIISLDALLLNKLSKESLRLVKERSKSTKRELEDEKKSLKDSEEELIRLIDKQGTTLEEIRMEFYNLPTAIQELEEVKSAKQKVLAHFEK